MPLCFSSNSNQDKRCRPSTCCVRCQDNSCSGRSEVYSGNTASGRQRLSQSGTTCWLRESQRATKISTRSHGDLLSHLLLLLCRHCYSVVVASPAAVDKRRPTNYWLQLTSRSWICTIVRNANDHINLSPCEQLKEEKSHWRNSFSLGTN